MSAILSSEPLYSGDVAGNATNVYQRDPDEKTRSLKGSACVVFITGAAVSKAFQFKTARALGNRVIAIDSERSDGRYLVSNGDIDEFIPLELSTDPEKAAEQCTACIKSCGKIVGGVVTFMEMAVYVTSLVAEALGLPGLPPMSVACAREKGRFRLAMRSAGLPNVKSHSIRSKGDLEKAAFQVGFPAVLKPIIGADSIAVKRVNTFIDLEQAFSEAVYVLTRVDISSGFLISPVREKGRNLCVLPIEFLLEEYLEGPEVDVDIVLRRGECWYSGVSDNGPTKEPYFTETYGVVPSLLPTEEQNVLSELAFESLKTLGFKDGVFHVEAKLTSCGPRIIEINSRMGGGPICEMHRRVNQIDLCEAQLRISLGLDFSPLAKIIKKPCFAYMTTNAVRSGTIGDDFSFLERFRDESGVVKIACRVKSGEAVIGPESGQPSWLLEIWMTGDDAEKIINQICQLSDEIAHLFCLSYTSSGAF